MNKKVSNNDYIADASRVDNQTSSQEKPINNIQETEKEIEDYYQSYKVGRTVTGNRRYQGTDDIKQNLNKKNTPNKTSSLKTTISGISQKYQNTETNENNVVHNVPELVR